MPELRKYKCCKCGYEEERFDFVDGIDCPHCAGFMYVAPALNFQEQYAEPKSEIIKPGDQRDARLE